MCVCVHDFSEERVHSIHQISKKGYDLQMVKY